MTAERGYILSCLQAVKFVQRSLLWWELVCWKKQKFIAEKSDKHEAIQSEFFSESFHSFIHTGIMKLSKNTIGMYVNVTQICRVIEQCNVFQATRAFPSIAEKQQGRRESNFRQSHYWLLIISLRLATSDKELFRLVFFTVACETRDDECAEGRLRPDVRNFHVGEKQGVLHSSGVAWNVQQTENDNNKREKLWFTLCTQRCNDVKSQ